MSTEEFEPIYDGSQQGLTALQFFDRSARWVNEYILEPILTSPQAKELKEAVRRRVGSLSPVDHLAEQRQPTLAQWQALWRREFKREQAPFPVWTEGNVFHHPLFDNIAYRYFDGKGRDRGLERLREMSYRSLASNEVEGSVVEWYERVQYLTCIQRYESALSQQNSPAQHKALVDLVLLRQSSLVSEGIKERIDRYLHGETAAGRLAERSVILARQEVRQQVSGRLDRASESFVTLLNSNGEDAIAIASNLRRFSDSARECGIPALTEEWVKQLGTLKQLKTAAEVLNGPFALSRQENVSNVSDALRALLLLADTRSGAELVACFGGDETIRSLIEQLKDPNKVSDARDRILRGFAHPDAQQLLKDAEIIRHLPITASDLLASGLVVRPDFLNWMRDSDAVKHIKNALAKFSDPESFSSKENIKDLKSALRQLASRDQSTDATETNALLAAFGGACRIESAALQLDSEPAKVVAFLRDCLRSPHVARLDQHARILRENPEALRDIERSVVETEKYWRDAGRAFQQLLGRDRNIQQLEQDCEGFLSAAARSRHGSIKSFCGWANLYTGLRELDLALNDGNDRAGQAANLKMSLTRLLRASEDKDNKHVVEVIEDFGGSSGIRKLLEHAKSGRTDEIARIYRRAMIFIPARQFLRDADAFRQFNPEDLLLSGALLQSRWPVLDAVRDCGAAMRLQKAASHHGVFRESDRQELVAALDQFFFAGKKLRNAAGGEGWLDLLTSLAKDRPYQAEECLRAVRQNLSGSECRQLLDRMQKEIKPAPLPGSSADLLRPHVPLEQLSSAIETARRRADNVNDRFDLLELKFLKRPGTNQLENWPAERELTLRELEEFGIANFGRGGDDSRTLCVPSLRALNTLLCLAEARGPALPHLICNY